VRACVCYTGEAYNMWIALLRLDKQNQKTVLVVVVLLSDTAKKTTHTHHRAAFIPPYQKTTTTTTHHTPQSSSTLSTTPFPSVSKVSNTWSLRDALSRFASAPVRRPGGAVQNQSPRRPIAALLSPGLDFKTVPSANQNVARFASRPFAASRTAPA